MKHKYKSVALSAFSMGEEKAEMHMVLRMAAKRAYGGMVGGSEKGGMLHGRRVFCPDLTMPDVADLIVYEGGEPVFIDVSPDDWCMDPEVLEIAFDKYPDVKIVIMTHFYGFPGQIGKVKEICEGHGALLIEDTRESLGASIHGKQIGSFGDYSVPGFHNGKLSSGMEGSMLQEYIAKKRAIYERYRERFSEDLMRLNPIGEGAEPNYRTVCMTVESDIGFTEMRSAEKYEYVSRHGTAAPMEIVDALAAFGAIGEPIRKPMHMRLLYGKYDQITLDGSKREYECSERNALLERCNESADIFRKGLCLPSDVRMTREEQDMVIEIVLACYSRRELDRRIWCAV